MSVAQTSFGTVDAKYTTHRRNAVLALYGLSAFWGVAQLVAPDNAIPYMASALAFAMSATLWFSTDCRILNRPRIPILQLLFFFTWPAASLVHLVASRGLRGVGFWVLHAVGLFATMCLTFFPALLLFYWLGFLDLDALAEP